MSKRTRVGSADHHQLGVTFFQSGATNLAIEQFTLATKRAPWVSTYWLNLGVALLVEGRLDEAERALRRTLELRPNSQSAYFHLAQLSHLRGDLDRARAMYEKAIEIDPSTTLARRARERAEGWRPRIIWMRDGCEQE